MRRLGIALAVVATVLVAGVIGVLLGLDRLIEANRARIVDGIAAGFGRPVRIDRITTGYHGGIAIALDGLHVGEDPAYGSGDFAAADRTYVVVKVWPLLRGRIAIRRIVVQAPRLTVVRTASGLSVDSLGRRPGSVPSPAPSSPNAAGTIPGVAIALLEMEDGAVRWIDRTKPVPAETTIAPLDVHLSDLSVTEPMRVQIDATVGGVAPGTVRVRGTIGPVGDPPFASDVPIEQHVAVHVAPLDVADLAITGRLRRAESGAPIASLRVAAPALSADGTELTALEMTGTERDGVATLERMAFRVFGGSVEGGGRVEHAGPTPSFAADLHVRDVDVALALAARQSELATRVQGRLDADCTVSGSAGPAEVVRGSIVAAGHAAVRNGVLEGVNVADGVLSGVTGVGGLATLVPERVRSRYADVFASGVTRFDELTSDVRVANERILLDSLVVAAPDWTVRGKGVVTFAQRVDVTATLTASSRLSADIVAALPVARALVDDAHLAIPFRLAGVPPDVRAQPDAEFVARVVRKALVENGLDRLLGGSHDADGTDRRDHDAIRRGLEKLFR